LKAKKELMNVQQASGLAPAYGRTHQSREKYRRNFAPSFFENFFANLEKILGLEVQN
jgi:hypothetical protein